MKTFTPRRRTILAQRNRQSAIDPSVAAGSGQAVDAPPVSREEEEAKALIWTPTTDVTAAVQVKPKRERLSLKRGRHAR